MLCPLNAAVKVACVTLILGCRHAHVGLRSMFCSSLYRRRANTSVPRPPVQLVPVDALPDVDHDGAVCSRLVQGDAVVW